MKIVKRSISEKDGAGAVVLRAEDSEDLWHAYHLVSPGDRVRSTTLRKVVREGATGSVRSEKVKISLTIEVKKTEFDAEVCVLHLAGTNSEESEHVKLGAYHTLHLELNRNFTVEKDCWDAVVLERLDEAADPARAAEVAAVAMQAGLGHVCLITGHMTITRAKVEVHIPKKRAGASGHAKAVARFNEQMYQAVLRHIDFAKIKCVLVGSPGFVSQDFMAYLQEKATAQGERTLLQHRSRFVLCHASSGHKRAVAEMLASPAVAHALSETRVLGDVQALEKFFHILNVDQDRAFYGFEHVFKADEMLAVDTLLVTDTLFKSCDVSTRKKYVALVESVREHGGACHIFSSLHVSGEQLKQLSGIAAILRYPVPELDVGDESESESDDDSVGGFVEGGGEGGGEGGRGGSGGGAAEEEDSETLRLREEMNDMGL